MGRGSELRIHLELVGGEAKALIYRIFCSLGAKFGFSQGEEQLKGVKTKFVCVHPTSLSLKI